MSTPSFAEALIASASTIVEVGGLRFRIRSVCSQDIFNAGGGFLLALPGRPKKRREGDAEEAKQALVAEIAARMQADPALLASGAAFMDAVVAAGVTGGTDKAEPAEPEELRVVLAKKDESGPDNRIHVGSLPSGVAPALAKAILAFSSNGGRAAEQLASFRRGGSRVPPRGR